MLTYTHKNMQIDILECISNEKESYYIYRNRILTSDKFSDIFSQMCRFYDVLEPYVRFCSFNENDFIVKIKRKRTVREFDISVIITENGYIYNSTLYKNINYLLQTIPDKYATNSACKNYFTLKQGCTNELCRKSHELSDRYITKTNINSKLLDSERFNLFGLCLDSILSECKNKTNCYKCHKLSSKNVKNVLNCLFTNYINYEEECRRKYYRKKNYDEHEYRHKSASTFSKN